MTAPEISNAPYDYTEFEYLHPNWWRELRLHTGVITPRISVIDQTILARLIPDETVLPHIARLGRSRDLGHPTILTTSGHVIQSIPPAGKNPGAIRVDQDIDAKGVEIIMALYAKGGHSFTANQIPFGKTATAEFKEHVRKLWSEVQGRQSMPSIPIARPPAASSPAYV